MSAIRMELNRQDFFPRLWANAQLGIERLGPASHRFAGFLWSNIGTGAPDDRSTWTHAEWQTHLSNPAHHFHAVFNDNEPIGCFEIIREPVLMARGGNVRITGFGLLPEFMGESFGPTLLTRVVEKAFALGAARIYFESEETLNPAMRLACENQGFKVS